MRGLDLNLRGDIAAVVQHDGEREAAFLQWCLIPSWSKDGRVYECAFRNNRGQPSFSEFFQKRRCLIPADGFYEWQRSGKIAQPYYFQMQDKSPFAFAGIWNEWQGDGNVIASCAIITTTANELLATIHDRMPVIYLPHHKVGGLTTNPIQGL